jgi:starch synthase
LQSRASDLFGIVNGIDDTVWNPATDKALPERYSGPSGKAVSKRFLQQEMQLELSDRAPLFCVISRLTRQKGLDLLMQSLDVLFKVGGQLALLGSGDADLEAGFEAAARANPGQMGCVIGYDEPLAHLLQAGSDAIIIPSRFEPCGLTQLCALRYGTIPIVARVGGLADTVIDANPAALMDGVATGVQFIPVDRSQLASAIERFTAIYKEKATFEKMRSHAMERMLGWDRPARQYLALYEGLLRKIKATLPQ